MLEENSCVCVCVCVREERGICPLVACTRVRGQVSNMQAGRYAANMCVAGASLRNLLIPKPLSHPLHRHRRQCKSQCTHGNKSLNTDLNLGSNTATTSISRKRKAACCRTLGLAEDSRLAPTVAAACSASSLSTGDESSTARLAKSSSRWKNCSGLSTGNTHAHKCT